MKDLKIAATLLTAFATLFVIIPSAHADALNQLTRVTINEPLRIPHEVLTPGTYWFMLPGTGMNYNPNMVAIYNWDRTHLIAMLPAVPTYRSKASARTQFIFAEQPNNAPNALLKWFYPGDHTGHAFLYSSRMQQRLSADNTESVRARNTTLG